MKKHLLLLFSLSLLAVSCTGEKAGSDDDGLQGTVDFGTRGPEANDVKILIFKNSGANSFYQETFAPTWVNNKATKTFRIGNSWQFLFYKAPSLSTTTMSALGSTTTVGDVTFTAKANGSKPGYILPVNEIWMPETATVAQTVYPIWGNSSLTVNDKLVRAVSGIDVYIKRGTKTGSGFTAIPYVSGDIRDLVKSVTLDISKLGTAFKVTGPVGNTGKTYVTLPTAGATPDAEGFVKLTGPLLFPNDITAGDRNTEVAISLEPQDPVSFPGTYTGSTKGMLNRNQKLQITVWFTSTGTYSIGVEVSYGPMGTDETGDKGIWN